MCVGPRHHAALFLCQCPSWYEAFLSPHVTAFHRCGRFFRHIFELKVAPRCSGSVFALVKQGEEVEGRPSGVSPLTLTGV